MNALNRLADGLNHIGRRGVQKVTFYCDDEPRLYIAGLSKAATVDTAFDTVREFAVGSHLVTRHVLSLIDRLLPRLDNEEMRQRLGEKATLYADIYLASSPAESDKAPIQRLVDSIADQLKSVGASNDEESSDYGTSGD